MPKRKSKAKMFSTPKTRFKGKGSKRKWEFRGFDTTKKISKDAKKYWQNLGYYVRLKKASKRDRKKGYLYRLYTKRK